MVARWSKRRSAWSTAMSRSPPFGRAAEKRRVAEPVSALYEQGSIACLQHTPRCRRVTSPALGGWIRREAPAERVEIGQSSGIKFGVDGLGEFGFAGTIMSERQQSYGGAAGLLFAITGQQCFEGAPVGAMREDLLTIDQIEQGHWLVAQGMDDVPVIDDVAMLSAGMRPPAAQRHQRGRAEEAFELNGTLLHGSVVGGEAWTV